MFTLITASSEVLVKHLQIPGVFPNNSLIFLSPNEEACTKVCTGFYL